MTEMLFSPAFWMPLALIVVGVGVFLFGNARVKSGIRNAGLGIFALAIGWMTMAYFVDTFSEKCEKRTSAIIDAVADGKWDEVTKLLDKNTLLAPLRGNEEISQTAERYATMAQVKAIHIFKTDTQVIPGGVDVTIDTIIEAQQNSTATWTFSYEQRSDGILLRQIVPIRLNGKSMEEIEKVIGRIGR